MLPVRLSWTLADASAKQNPTHQLSLTKPRLLGQAGFQCLVSKAGDAGPRDPAQDLKRRELEKAPKRLNHLSDAPFTVPCLPALDYARSPPVTLDYVRIWDWSFCHFGLSPASSIHLLSGISEKEKWSHGSSNNVLV